MDAQKKPEPGKRYLLVEAGWYEHIRRELENDHPWMQTADDHRMALEEMLHDAIEFTVEEGGPFPDSWKLKEHS